MIWKQFLKGAFKGTNNQLLRKAVSQMAQVANKRIKRLEAKGLQSSPAYQKWLGDGAEKFGVKGKDHNQVQQELARLKKFLESQTSTIRGVNKTLKEMATNTGIQYKNISELQTKANTFFTLASKVEQYLRTVDDMASAIGYQKIWEAINVYVKETGTDLSDAKLDVENLTNAIVNEIEANSSNFNSDFSNSIWSVLN